MLAAPMPFPGLSDYKNLFSDIFLKVKESAGQIIAAKGATNYSIALALVKITRSILRSENSILSVSTLITDYYGVSAVCISILSFMNRNGVEHYLELQLSKHEQEQFIHSAYTLQQVIENLNI